MTAVLGRRAGTEVAVDQVRAAVAAVTDPELGLPLGELGMVGDVRVGRTGRAQVTVRLTTPNCPLATELTTAVAHAVRQVPGIRQATVRTGAMSVRERTELADRLRRRRAPAAGSTPGGRQPAVYAVASGKGGVGKSTLTANLAAALAAQGKRIGVVDADVWGYSLPQLFGVRRSPVVLGGAMLPVPAHGVLLMSVGFFVDDDSPVVWRGPMLHKALEQLLRDTHWGTLDALLVDLPPGTGDAALSLTELLPDAALLAVTTPQKTAQVVARRMVRMAADAGMPIAGVVENMSASICPGCGGRSTPFGDGGGALIAEEFGVPLLGRVPLDAELRRAGDAGTPVVLAAPQAASACELTRIAAALPSPRRSIARRPLPLEVIRSPGG
ncbi:Mrp/NBP35 family ATP-binding protein [Pseudonocardia sp. RS010]|uniref:Mrp/NBP35 family ATP-binding protein n=1 Tax=Pseudonocardia sp. RS010 TaxID=3385979 RepID=UPI0039A30E0B